MRKSIVTVAASLLFVVSTLQVIFGLARHLGTPLIDYEVYHVYSQLLLSGKNPYDLNITQGVPLNYPPSSFMLFVPFSLLTQPSAQILFTAVSLSVFLTTAYLFIREFVKKSWIILLLLSLLVQNFPTKFTLILGQSNLIVLSLLFLSFVALKKHQTLSGVLWGLAGAVKMTPLILVFFFLLRKKCRALMVGLMVFVSANLLIFLSFPSTLTYFTQRIATLAKLSPQYTTLYDHSLRALYYRLGLPYPAILQTISSFFLLGIIILCFYRDAKNTTAGGDFLSLRFLSLLLILVTISNSFAWQHHFVFLFPGFIAEAVNLLKKKNLIRGALLVISALLVGYHFPDIAHPPTSNPFLISHTLVGALFLMGLLLTD